MRKRWKYTIKEIIEHMFGVKWIVVGIVFYLRSMMLKQEIVQVAYEKKVSFNNWDITLRLLNDAYLIIYFIIPIVLFFSVKSIFVDFDYQILIRLRSFKKWVYYSLRNFWMNIFPLLFLWFFMSLFMTIGFPYSWNWSELGEAAHFTNTLHELVYFFKKPVFAFIAQFILVLLTSSLLHIVFAIIYVLTKSKHVVIFISILFFLFNIIGFKLFPNEIAFLSPVTFFSITSGVNVFHSPIQVYSVVIIFLVFCVWLLQFLDVNKGRYISSIKSNIPIVVYFSLCVMGVSATAQSLVKSSHATNSDVLIMSFAGVSAERFAYIPFFFYLVVFFGFTYLIQLLFLSNEIEQLGYYKIIRFRSLNKWFWSWMKKLMVIIVVFLFGLVILSFTIAVCFGADTDFYVTLLPNSLFEIGYHFFINGFLQMIFYVSLIFIVSWISRESIYGVALMSILMVVMLPGINAKALIPVGLNSIVYLADYSPYYLTFILVIANMISYVIIRYLLKQSLNI